MKRLIICILLTSFFLDLEGTEFFPEQQPYSFSKEKILDSFFQELFENTTTGYVVYGQKPIELIGIKDLENTIPGSKEHYFSVKMLIGSEMWNEMPSKLIKNKAIIIKSSQNDELIIINRQAFLQVVNQNLLLFKYKFGINITAEGLLSSLEKSKNSFQTLFKEKIALQGIIFGYGVENAITYEKVSLLKKMLMSNTPSEPPYQESSFPKNENEVVKQLENNSDTKKTWIKIKEEAKDFSYYRPSSANDHLKIPFSFHQNSLESTRLFKEYRKSQSKINTLMGSKNFIHKLLAKLGKNNNRSFAYELKSHKLNKFFSNNEKKLLPDIIAKSIYNTFSDLDLSILIKGMQTIDAKTENIEIEDYQDVKFLDLLRKEALLTKNFRKKEQESQQFFNNISLKKDSSCLIPHKLYIRTLKEGVAEKKLDHYQKRIKVNYLLKDIKGKVLTGNYKFEDLSELNLSKIIPGFAHGLLGMKAGEIRKIYIHPDFVYGINSDFGEGRPIQVKVELISFGESSEKNNFPQIKPLNVGSDVQISSCFKFLDLQNKYANFCGLKTWSHYKKAVPFITLDKIVASLNELIDGKKTQLSNEEKKLLLKFEWMLYQK